MPDAKRMEKALKAIRYFWQWGEPLSPSALISDGEETAAEMVNRALIELGQVYTVWGGYKGQAYGEHYATFRDPHLAARYRERMETDNPNLRLIITPTSAHEGGVYADEEEKNISKNPGSED